MKYLTLAFTLFIGTVMAEPIPLEELALSTIPKQLAQVELPSGMRVYADPGAPPTLIHYLRQAGNEIVDSHPYDLAIMPYGSALATDVHLGIWYESQGGFGHHLVKLTPELLDKKVKAMECFHLSQSKRTDFPGIIEAMAEAFEGAEAFEWDECQSMEDFDALIIAAPHPDDAEIGAGALIATLENTSTQVIVWNLAAGHRALMEGQDLSGGAHYSQSLMKKVPGSGAITDPAVKREIRAEESFHALHYLNGQITVRQLDLPFYEAPGYQTGADDASPLNEELSQLQDKKILILAPYPKDEHPAHRMSAYLIEQVAMEHPNVTMGYYRTPWSDYYNLYLYGQSGSKLGALVGTERLAGKGERAYSLEQLGGPLAERYLVFKRDESL